MNEEPKNIWKRPLQGWQEILCWFGLMVLVTHLTVLCLAYVSSGKRSYEDLMLSALIIATVLVSLLLSFRWLCCWRNLRRFLFVVACLATLIALVLVEENWRGKRAWESHKRELEAKGEKLTLEEVVPPPVPENQNFALTPLLRAWLDYDRANKVKWNDTNGIARIQRFTDALGKDSGDQKIVFGDLDKGTFDDVEAWFEAFRHNPAYEMSNTSTPAAIAILTALRKFDAEFDELQTAAAARPLSRFPVHYDEEPSWGILLPHLAQQKGLSRIFRFRAVAEMEAGLSDEALNDTKLCFRLSDSIKDEPFLICHLVRIASLEIALQTVREGLVRHIWNDGQLTELENNLASVNLLAEYNHTMRGERAFNVSGIDYLRTRGSKGPEFLYVTEDGGTKSTKLLAQAGMLGGFIYQNMVAISQMHEDYTLKVVDENKRRVFPEIARKGDEVATYLAAHRYSHPYKIFVGMLFPAVSGAAAKTACGQTYVDAARVGCALERYRLANGKLPEALDALVPRFINAIPNDVMDGKPLRYRQTGDGSYILYSIGWDEKDDVGELGWKTAKEHSLDIKSGDWVWQMPAN